ncbi:hypothetical protein T09_11025 [Trichinella sp. T9]|nr:hypothetical protein T09_11025 [Trichinella sp. T9]
MREIYRDLVKGNQLYNTHEKLVNCSWMSLYIPKLDATCVLTAKAIRHEDIGQSMHLLLHSCHEDISNIPVGMILQNVYQRNNSAKIHTPSTHKNCHIFRLPFVENFYAQRIQLIATSSLKRCIAFCEAPTHTSCNSVLFSAQEGTCLLLSKARNTTLFGGIAPTLQSSALFFIIFICYNDFHFPHAYSIPRFGEIAPTVYNIFNMTVSLYRVHFYATKAGIRIGLWETVDEYYCLMICLNKFLAGYCDGYYFSHGEKTCLTLSIRKKYALPRSPLTPRIIQFSDDGIPISIVKDLRMLPLKHSNHFTTEEKISLFQYKEICTVQHSVSNVIPWINLVQLYANVSFLNECIGICRFMRNFGLCQGIAYSKESKACHTTVLGNYDDEVYLNEGYHFFTLNNCSKDRENERADNDQPELHVLPILDEVCQLEFYKPLFLSGWSVIIEVANTTTLLECLISCATVMQAKKCSAIYFTDESCILLERMPHLQYHFIRQKASRIQLIATSSLKRCIAFCEAPTHTSCNSVLFSAQEGTCLLLSRARNLTLFGGIIPTLQTSALFFIISTCYNDFDFPYAYSIPRFGEIAPTVYNIFNLTVSLYRVHFYATKAGIRTALWDTVDENYCLMICLDKFMADYCDGYYFSYGEKTCLTFSIRKKYALPNSPLNRRIIQFSDDGMLINIVKDLRMLPLKHSNHFTTEAKVSLFQFKEICTVQHSVSNVIPWINIVQQYVNISYLNDCIRICRFIRNFGLCQGIAYSKESKVCFIAVLGDNDDEVYLNEGFHFLTLNDCSKDRENERADNDPPELHVLPLVSYNRNTKYCYSSRMPNELCSSYARN